MALILGLSITILIIIFIIKNITSPEVNLIEEFYRSQGVILDNTTWSPPKRIYNMPDDNIRLFLKWIKEKKKLSAIQLYCYTTKQSQKFLERKVSTFTNSKDLFSYLP